MTESPFCKVTFPNESGLRRGGGPRQKCGAPTVKYGLCQRHYDDRVRLGGTP